MKTRLIYTDFWKDNYVCSLPPKEKLLFVYLLTNDRVSISGVYQLPDMYIKMDCGLTQPELETIKKKFIDDGKFYFQNGWVRIMNYEKFNFYKGDKNINAINRERALAPSFMIQYRYPIDRVSATADTLSNHNHNHNSNINIYRGVVKRGDSSSFESLTPVILQEIAEKYQVPVSFVQSRKDDMENWLKAKGKRYKDYKHALMNWVKSDALKIIDRERKESTRFQVLEV